jgi:hypothetical protein
MFATRSNRVPLKWANRAAVGTTLAGAMALVPLTGCQNLPGGAKEQGAVIGGAGGAAAGAVIAKHNRGLGALIGGLVGAGGGYIIGASQEKVDKNKTDEASQAADRAVKNPAGREAVFKSQTADLNNDGFVTMDEVVALRNAGLSDSEMIDRLRRTDQVFELSDQQQNYLRDRGVTQRVIDAMLGMNRTGAPADARTASGTLSGTDRTGPGDRPGDYGTTADRPGNP